MTADDDMKPDGATAIARAIDDARIVASPPEDADSARLNLSLAGQVRNDIGNAERLVARKGHDLFFVKDAGWHGWTGTHWSLDDGTRLARIAAQETAIAIFAEANAMKAAGPREGESRPDFEDRVDGHRKWASGSGKSDRLSAMLREAEVHLDTPLDALDADPYLLNVENGTLDLGAEVVFRGHDRADMATRLAPVAFDADAAAPTWRAFLDEVVPDKETQTFLQRWTGYAMTGDVGGQCLVLLYGPGANGKTTFVGTVMRMLGDYARTLPVESLLHNDRQRGGDATPDLARLPGARLVVASEPPEGARISETSIKKLTGGEAIVARHLHKGFFEFAPRFKIMVSFNHKPSVRGQDEGIWRRLRLVPFDVTIPEGRRDPELGDRLAAELPGILNWGLDGFRLWRERGLDPSSKILEATALYRDEYDKIGPFLAAAIAADPGAQVRFKDIFAAYCGWCRANAQAPLSATWLGRQLVERGYPRFKSGDLYYGGLKIVQAYAQHQKPEDAAAPAGYDDTIPPPKAGR